jgi:hypothetical protein
VPEFELFGTSHKLRRSGGLCGRSEADRDFEDNQTDHRVGDFRPTGVSGFAIAISVIRLSFRQSHASIATGIKTGI